jgi:hypothetical protein
VTHYDRLKRKRLGDVLVDEGLCPQDRVIAALHEQQETGALLSDILVESRDVNEYDLSRVIVEQYQAPYIDLKGYTFHKDLFEEFPADLLHSAKVIPLDRFGKQVCFACQEIPSEERAAALRKKAPDGIYFFVASTYEIRAALAEHRPLEAAAPANEAPAALAELQKDQSWTSLFDEANAAVLGDIDPDE